MGMPGFTAETSLYQTSEHYHIYRVFTQDNGLIHLAQNQDCLDECFDGCNGGDPWLTGPERAACYNRCIRKCSKVP